MRIRRTLALLVVPGAVAAFGLASVPAASALSFGSVKATPAAHLVDGQSISLKVAGFGTATTAYVIQCDQRVTSSQDQTYCDQTPAHVGVQPLTDGAATFDYTVHAGAGFGATHTGARCDALHPCELIVSDTPTNPPNTVAITEVDFGWATRTVVYSRTTVKAHHDVTFTAVTTRAKGNVAPTGKVVFRDNGTKFATVTETSFGIVKAVHKMSKGKHTITATYSGDSLFDTSHGKETVKVLAA
jgi:Big-like domain-containing protein